ncbi:hypothetical protein T07_10439 [Trichinella nelsoni]|uniref:Uncharacterized protein n=1 Tax=Trichinella nelsoni TaxID=6336 RepID=A0A0V0RLR7_9BILA|nr:hypothetical protein T07_10439 [Trichinella nelsoni]
MRRFFTPSLFKVERKFETATILYFCKLFFAYFVASDIAERACAVCAKFEISQLCGVVYWTDDLVERLPDLLCFALFRFRSALAGNWQHLLPIIACLTCYCRTSWALARYPLLFNEHFSPVCRQVNRQCVSKREIDSEQTIDVPSTYALS